MILTLSPQSVDQYRKSKQVPLSLVAKRCKCGARVYAVTLTRYGMCEKCWEVK